MYIKKISINNLRSIQAFTMDFGDNPAGWHVLLGDNGTGKTSILRAIALSIIGTTDILRLDPDWNNWLKKGSVENTSITCEYVRNTKLDNFIGKGNKTTKPFLDFKLIIKENNAPIGLEVVTSNLSLSQNGLWSTATGWFAMGIGALRRFRGGSTDAERLYITSPKTAAFLTLFKDDTSLSAITQWLTDLRLAKLDSNSNAVKILTGIENFFSNPGLLPHGFVLSGIRADGLYFKNNTGTEIHFYELSEGMKSVLCLAMELIRNLCRTYEPEWIFQNIDKVECEGVVLIDEIDAHLHPAWQAIIGNWFTQVFPKIQFIVTTHSPLICRSCGDYIDNKVVFKGNIWHLTANTVVEKPISNAQRAQLINGNILEAYSTDLFGADLEIADGGQRILERYAFLSQRLLFDKNMPEAEKTELANLQKDYIQ
jgi:hypothetical protein